MSHVGKTAAQTLNKILVVDLIENFFKTMEREFKT
jgi:hypothetical protein